ncbi:MAG TPA: histidine phosphatase family protein [Caulobacteraceae bacterium]|nr:histidine phosphatase family protein [Caulobacteraceae bacterium]
MADGVPAGLPEFAVRPGAVILARHGQPALSREVRLSADEYREWWADYEMGGLAEGQAPPEALRLAADRAGFIIASTRLRSVETARAICCGRAFAEDPMFIEAPLPPPHWPSWLKLSPRIWGVVSRFWWWMFNHHDSQESRAEAETRAEEAARQLAELAASGQDVLVVAHGFFNTMVGRALGRQGWRCTVDGGFSYWASRRFELTRG